MSHLFLFGPGYTALRLARAVMAKGWRVSATARSAERVGSLEAQGIAAITFDGVAPLAPSALDDVSHILSSVPPDAAGDPVIRLARAALVAAAPHMKWCGYLSTTGVYGDRKGDWVDEASPLQPTTERARRRLAAETAWLALHRQSRLPVHLFRLPGVYGPGRNALEDLRAGRARRIVKEGQFFSRIHVDDIVRILMASMARPRPGAAYNVTDDEPAPAGDVVVFAAELLGLAPPEPIPFEMAEMSEMARSFYAESKRVSNRLIKSELGAELLYPTYREGLRACAREIPPARG